MIIANNATFKMFVTDYQKQNSKLQTSMSRLSAGSRFTSPGDAPADLGISERFRAQIRNSEEAGRVIQNAVNMLQSTDAWMQEAHNILDRMSELSIAASDGSKSQQDRVNLDLEFQQLKTEVARISEAGKYNGLQINGNTAIAVWDTIRKEIIYSQSDGSDVRSMGIEMRAGNTSSNGFEYAFESSASSGVVGDFLFTEDGKSLVYVAQRDAGTSISAQRTIVRLDIEGNNISTVQMDFDGGTSASTQARIVMDEKGRIWASNPDTATTDAGTGGYNVNLLDIKEMVLDAGGTAATNEWAGGVTLASGFSNFAVHDDNIFYIERSAAGAVARYVKRSLFDTTSTEILLNDLSGTDFDMDAGETYAISNDGQYIAFEDEDNATPGTLVVINAFSGEKAELQVGTRSNSITALDFDANNNLYWTNTGGIADENAIKRAKITFGENPEITDVQTIRTDNAGHFGAFDSANAANGMGLSVGGGSPATDYEFQIGPDKGMNVNFTTADVRLTKLGVSTLDVLTIDNAQDAVASIAKAIDVVANQRAVIGSQVSRLGFTFNANQGYGNNIAAAEARLRDVDFATESSKLASSQVSAQASISMLSQANLLKQSVLGLLQG